MKQCSNPDCKQWFPATLDFFPKDNSRKDGLHLLCKPCKRVHDTEYMKRYRQTPKNKAYQKEWNAEYNPTHKEQIRQQQKGYHEQNKEWRNAQKRQYRKSNPELFASFDKAHKAQRRAQKLASGGSHTAQDIQEQFQRQKGKCYYCKKKLDKYHPDHIVPLNRGGSNDISNIVLACPDCNMRKHDKLPHEWLDGGRLL